MLRSADPLTGGITYNPASFRPFVPRRLPLLEKAMKLPTPRTAVACAVCLSLVALQLADVSGAGFGLKKRKISLSVRRPAAVRLANTTVAFVGSVTNKEYEPVLGSLETSLETELVSNEKTLIRQPTPADASWLIKLTVTGYSAPVSTQRTEPQSRTTVTAVRWAGALTVAYQVTEKSGRVHDADNVETRFDKEYNAANSGGGSRFIPSLLGGGQNEPMPSTAEDVKQLIVKDIVRQIATKLGNTAQSVEVQVAGGEDVLERAGDFYEKRLWQRGLDELEKSAALPKPEDEAYRQYNLGLGYEGISYEAKSYNEQRASLFKAQEHYDRATDLNTKEKYFVESVARAREAVAQYKTLDASQREDRTAKPAAADRPAGGRAPEPPKASAAEALKPLNLNDVIEMHLGGVESQAIVETIQQSPGQYDLLSKDSLLAIAKAKLPSNVQNEMRKKAGLPPLAGARGTRSGGAAPAPGAGSGGAATSTGAAPAKPPAPAPAPAPKK